MTRASAQRTRGKIRQDSKRVVSESDNCCTNEYILIKHHQRYITLATRIRRQKKRKELKEVSRKRGEE